MRLLPLLVAASTLTLWADPSPKSLGKIVVMGRQDSLLGVADSATIGVTGAVQLGELDRVGQAGADHREAGGPGLVGSGVVLREVIGRVEAPGPTRLEAVQGRADAAGRDPRKSL